MTVGRSKFRTASTRIVNGFKSAAVVKCPRYCSSLLPKTHFDTLITKLFTRTTEEMRSVSVSIADLIEYFGVAKRSKKMGEEIVNARRVLTVGFEPGRQDLLALVVRTTSLTELPHEVKLTNMNLDVNQWIGICSYKAGAGQKCTHRVIPDTQPIRDTQTLVYAVPPILSKHGKKGKEIVASYQFTKIHFVPVKTLLNTFLEPTGLFFVILKIQNGEFRLIHFAPSNLYLLRCHTYFQSF